MRSLSPAYFDALYAADPDPWLSETSEYHLARDHAVLATLPQPHYRRGLEVGCATGVLTARLAERCGQLLAIDVAEGALVQARARLQGAGNVRFAARAFPGELAQDAPADGYDLILLSEILHYLDAQALVRAVRMTRAVAARGAHVQLVSRLGPAADSPTTGDAAAAIFIAALRPVAPIILQMRTADYRIDVLQL